MHTLLGVSYCSTPLTATPADTEGALLYTEGTLLYTEGTVLYAEGTPADTEGTLLYAVGVLELATQHHSLCLLGQKQHPALQHGAAWLFSNSGTDSYRSRHDCSSDLPMLDSASSEPACTAHISGQLLLYHMCCI